MSKTLVIYGTRFGSTKEIAEFIVKTIQDQNQKADLFDTEKPPQNIDKYDLVIIGSGIQIGKWTNDVLNFLKKNQKQLKKKKTALFVSCAFAMYPEKQEESTQKFLVDVAEKYGLDPISIGLFGSCLDFTGKKGLKYRLMVRMMKEDLEKMGVEYDETYEFRDWPKIKRWTEELVTHLQ